ncbi:MAG: homogentisate 1,2-dioxygenase [Nitrospina sp.]|nr:homogentisate 1,2-dioxygenase [Nitrospina sp.]
MNQYLKYGRIAPLHHVAHYSGNRLLHEYCFTREGFEEPYSILYLHHPPTGESGQEIYEEARWACPDPVETPVLQRRHFRTGNLEACGTYLTGRTILAFNDDVHYGVCHPQSPETAFFANNDADELFFLYRGRVHLQSLFGKMDLEPGDFLIIPRSCPYRLNFEGNPLLLYVEAHGDVGVPEEFRNPWGQLKLDAPYSERSFKVPEWDAALFESEEPATIIRKRQARFTRTHYPENYFKMEGWDGYVYPHALNLDRIQPKTGRVHLPPSSHMTFAGRGFAVMSFLPRVLDFDQNAVPCPFYHSSVDCDELLFYVSGDFTSRKGVESGSISFHPSGIPHGPHPGAYQSSIGKKDTREKAVMVDTFHPLNLTEAGRAIEDPDYPKSWREERA